MLDTGIAFGACSAAAATSVDSGLLAQRFDGTSVEFGVLAQRFAGTSVECGVLARRLAGTSLDFGGLARRFAGTSVDFGGLARRFAGTSVDFGGLARRFAVDFASVAGGSMDRGGRKLGSAGCINRSIGPTTGARRAAVSRRGPIGERTPCEDSNAHTWNNLMNNTQTTRWQNVMWGIVWIFKKASS